jgi:hypothetical protein
MNAPSAFICAFQESVTRRPESSESGAAMSALMCVRPHSGPWQARRAAG